MGRRIKAAEEIIAKYGYIYRCSISENTPSEEKVCLRNRNQKWHIFYVERGCEYDVSIFDDEDLACQELIKRTILDKSKCTLALEEYQK